MLSRRNAPSITYEPSDIIQPIYTGGDVGLDDTGRLLVSCLGEEVVISDLSTGKLLSRIDGVGDYYGKTNGGVR